MRLGFQYIAPADPDAVNAIVNQVDTLLRGLSLPGFGGITYDGASLFVEFDGVPSPTDFAAAAATVQGYTYEPPAAP